MIGYLPVLQPDACAHIVHYGLVIYEAQCPMMVTEFPKNSIFDVVEFLGNTFVSEIFVGYFIYFLHIACMKKCWKTFRAHFFGTYTIQTVKKTRFVFLKNVNQICQHFAITCSIPLLTVSVKFSMVCRSVFTFQFDFVSSLFYWLVLGYINILMEVSNSVSWFNTSGNMTQDSFLVPINIKCLCTNILEDTHGEKTQSTKSQAHPKKI